ncbi:MAG: hypothetical protein MJ168_12300 [Clostridia bacterium]|nr:hypothetical protein [Clostridia bacterium]
MDIIKLRNAVIAAIDESSIKAKNGKECFCACVEYSKFEHQETLEITFYTDDNENTVFYAFHHDFKNHEISVTRRYQSESRTSSLIYSKAIEELRNEFKKIGVNFDGKYI